MTTVPFTVRPLAPAVFIGIQQGLGAIPAIELYNLTATVGEYREGTTVSRHTIETMGFYVPAVPSKPAAIDTATESLRERRRAAWYRRNYDYAGYSRAA